MSKELDLEFENDEQIEAVLDAICEAVEEDEKRPTVLKPIRFEQINFCYAVMKRLTKDLKGVKVTYGLHKPFKSMGFVSVEGKELKFADSEWFARAAEFASNMEVYSLEQNKVRLTFTFHGLTVPLE